MTGKVVARTTRYHEVAAIDRDPAAIGGAAATLHPVKRQPNRAWPRQIVEVASRREDPRADPQATQKISREELDAALRRTKSGTRAATRSEPDIDRDGFAGPRDDSPEITIVRIDSVEMSVFDPSSVSSPSAPSPSTSQVVPVSTPDEERHSAVTPRSRRLSITPRAAFIIGIALAAFVTVAAVIGFFAGRFTSH